MPRSYKSPENVHRRRGQPSSCSLAGARKSGVPPTRGQPHETYTNRRLSGNGRKPYANGSRGEAPTRPSGDLWRFRKANLLVGEP